MLRPGSRAHGTTRASQTRAPPPRGTPRVLRLLMTARCAAPRYVSGLPSVSPPPWLLSREAPGGSRPPRRGGGRGEWAERVVNVGEVVPLIIALALVGIILLALVAWFASRSATQPLAEALRVQRNFIADASHELRTPLTTLDSRIQLAQHRLDRGGDVEGALKEVWSDTKPVKKALDDAVLLARVPAAAPVKK